MAFCRMPIDKLVWLRLALNYITVLLKYVSTLRNTGYLQRDVENMEGWLWISMKKKRKKLSVVEKQLSVGVKLSSVAKYI